VIKSDHDDSVCASPFGPRAMRQGGLADHAGENGAAPWMGALSPGPAARGTAQQTLATEHAAGLAWHVARKHHGWEMQRPVSAC
jgi:hypothetical protein